MSGRLSVGTSMDHGAANTIGCSATACDLSPLPILAALAAYRGRFVDLDQQVEADAAALQGAADCLARQLAAEGLGHGDRVVMAVGNGPKFVAALAALLGAGAAPLVVHVKTPAAELRRTALRYGAPFVLTDDLEPDSLESEEMRASFVSGAPWAEAVWGAVDADQPEFQCDYPPLPGVPLHPTSGTSGEPKLAIRPAAAAVAEGTHYAETIGVVSSDVILALTPMSHAYAFGACVLLPLLRHATVLSQRRFGVKGVHEALQQGGVTILPAVPAMLDMLLFGAAARGLHVPRVVLSAGAPLARRTAENFRAATGRLVRPLYGTTETGGITVRMEGVEPEEGGCVGRPMDGVSARLGPAEGDLSDARVGRVHIRSSSMMLGYLAPGGIDRSPLCDGWFRTGDLGRIDQRGHLHLVGRESEVINVSGMKVVPGEIEEVLCRLPGVVECKVYAGQRRAGSQFVKAAVVAEPAVDLARLRAWCEAHLVYYKRPEAVYRLDALPRSPAGKILRDQLP